MRIVIAGGSGLLGSALTRALVADRHSVTILTRSPKKEATGAQYVPWTPDGSVGPWSDSIGGVDAVVNLAGESIAGSRWSDAHKQRILDSRVKATSSLVGAIRAARTPPAAFISGSAVGYYGPCGDEVLTEVSPSGRDFLASVCVAWEGAAKAAAERTRVAFIRTGLVLARDGGALPQMLPPFWFGAGGPVGSGRQYWPWIHVHDWVEAVRWMIGNASVTGAVNVTAPTPVPNATFAKALGKALHRPAFMPAPGFALKLLLGEMAEALLLSGQRAIPEKAQQNGFTFRFAALDAALANLFP